MKQLEVLLTPSNPPGWDASPLWDYPQVFASLHRLVHCRLFVGQGHMMERAHVMNLVRLPILRPLLLKHEILW